MVIVSRDVRVNEASELDWNNSTEVNIEVGESSVAAPTSAPTDLEISDDEDEPQQPKMRSLRDLYDSTDEVHLVCLLADAENIRFEEAVRDIKWQTAMDEEKKKSREEIERARESKFNFCIVCNTENVFENFFVSLSLPFDTPFKVS